MIEPIYSIENFQDSKGIHEINSPRTLGTESTDIRRKSQGHECDTFGKYNDQVDLCSVIGYLHNDLSIVTIYMVI